MRSVVQVIAEAVCFVMFVAIMLLCFAVILAVIVG